VLANILPGLRDLRVPLTSGLVWLLSAWIVVEPHLPDEEPTGVLGSLYRLEDVFGITALTAATLFSAYLIGIMVPYYKLPMHRIQRLWTAEIKSDHHLLAISTGARAELARFIEQPVYEAARLLAAAGPWGKGQEAPTEHQAASAITLQVIENILDEERYLALRLLTQDKEHLYQSYDRKIAEAQFRHGLVYPTLGLVAVLAFTASHFWWFAIAVPIGLNILSLWSHREAMDDLSHAIVSGAIKSTVIVLLQQVVDTNDVEQIRLWTTPSRRFPLYGYFLQTHDGAESRLPSVSSQRVARPSSGD